MYFKLLPCKDVFQHVAVSLALQLLASALIQRVKLLAVGWALITTTMLKLPTKAR